MAEQDVSRQVLVLSDAEDVTLVIQELLEDEGYRVTSRAYLTGDIGAVTSDSPDAILIDCNRMELDESVAFIRKIRSWPHLQSIPIVACTSAVRLVDNYRASIEDLSVEIIKKPFDINDLANVIAECFAGGSTTTYSRP